MKPPATRRRGSPEARRQSSPKARRRSSVSTVLRIQAGKWKGRRLDVPAGARPTSGRARAALFDLLGPDRIRGARVLDLFAGSGAVGLEAVSRGAAAAVLVEADAEALHRTWERMDADDEVRILASDAEAAAERLVRAGERFDVVFADPPYGFEHGRRALEQAARLLTEDGVLIVQSDAGDAVTPPGRLRAIGHREYGRNVFHFFGIPRDGALT